jgi:hypothetical protein
LIDVLSGKRLGLLGEIVPAATLIAVLLNPTWPTFDTQLNDMQRAGTLRYTGPPRPGPLLNRPRGDKCSKQGKPSQANRGPKNLGRSTPDFVSCSARAGSTRFVMKNWRRLFQPAPDLLLVNSHFDNSAFIE